MPNQKIPKIFIIVGTILTAFLVFANRVFQVANVTSPQKVTIALRNTVTVAKGMAEVRLMPDVDKGGNGNETVSENPRVDVKCNGKELHQIKLTSMPSETVCGIQLKVLRVYKSGTGGDYPYADIEVTW